MCHSNIRKLIAISSTGLFPEMMQPRPLKFLEILETGFRTAPTPTPTNYHPPSTPFWIAGVTGALTGITGGAGGESEALGALTWKMGSRILVSMATNFQVGKVISCVQIMANVWTQSHGGGYFRWFSSRKEVIFRFQPLIFRGVCCLQIMKNADFGLRKSSHPM